MGSARDATTIPITAPRRRRGARRLSAVALIASLVLGVNGTASAYSVISETGLVGPYFMIDTPDSPGGKCAYSEFRNGQSLFRWMKVMPPNVRAADRNADRRDTRIVSWRFKLQKGLEAWTTVAQSPLQRARAYEDAAAPFQPMKVYYNATSPQAPYRALMVINWHAPDGSVEGKVKLMVQFYLLKGMPTVDSDFCRGGFVLD